ncbi:hypothetical protein ACQ4N7_14995 [Nodosilinea sp. AN01ver1]|uniref:hypothetical protein n=1 Tax=Nodosilinea sp. AN01ver1 TaxID=3423362 RepID=UPI003D31C8BC
MVSPVIPRPALDVSPPPPSRATAALLRPKWRRALPRVKHPQMWGLGLGSLALGLVNGALVISAGIALVAYQQILQLSPRQRKGLVQRLQQGLPLPTSPQQQALMVAGVAGVSTYTFTALWHSTHSLLMALLLTGQGALALFAVGALLRSPRSAERSNDLWDAAPVAQVEHNLSLLSHPDPLKRLVAVRRLVRLVEQGAVDSSYSAGVSVRSHLIDCFQLRLSQESDAIVRSALEDGQTLLRQAKPLPPSTAAPFSAELSSTTFSANSALDIAEVNSSVSETQPVAELGASGLPESFSLEDSEPAVALDSPPIDPVASTATDTPPAAVKGRRGTVEYVEYLDI